MPQEVVRVGIVATSRPVLSEWGASQQNKRTLRPTALLDTLPALEPGARMVTRGEVWTEYLGDYAIRLHSGETAHYVDNLRARVPSVWVLMDADKVRLVTVDPYEGEALAGDPERQVDVAPMPAGLAARLEAFIAAHHVHEVFAKRRRKPASSPDDPRPPRLLREDEKWVQSRGRASLGGDGGGGPG